MPSVSTTGPRKRSLPERQVEVIDDQPGSLRPIESEAAKEMLSQRSSAASIHIGQRFDHDVTGRPTQAPFSPDERVGLAPGPHLKSHPFRAAATCYNEDHESYIMPRPLA